MEYTIPGAFQGSFRTNNATSLPQNKTENSENSYIKEHKAIIGAAGALCLGALILGGILINKKMPPSCSKIVQNEADKFMEGANLAKKEALRVLEEIKDKKNLTMFQMKAAFREARLSAKETRKKADIMADEILGIIDRGKRNGFKNLQANGRPSVEFLKDENGVVQRVFEYSASGDIIRECKIKSLDNFDFDVIDHKNSFELEIRNRLKKTFKTGKRETKNGLLRYSEILNFDKFGKMESHYTDAQINSSGQIFKALMETTFQNGRIKSVGYGKDNTQPALNTYLRKYILSDAKAMSDGKSITVVGFTPSSNTGTKMKFIGNRLVNFNETATKGKNFDIISQNASFDPKTKTLEYTKEKNGSILERYVFQDRKLVLSENDILEKGSEKYIGRRYIYNNAGNPISCSQNISVDQHGKQVTDTIYRYDDDGDIISRNKEPFRMIKGGLKDAEDGAAQSA